MHSKNFEKKRHIYAYSNIARRKNFSFSFSLRQLGARYSCCIGTVVYIEGLEVIALLQKSISSALQFLLYVCVQFSPPQNQQHPFLV